MLPNSRAMMAGSLGDGSCSRTIRNSCMLCRRKFKYTEYFISVTLHRFIKMTTVSQN